jgi:hypothetical protein
LVTIRFDEVPLRSALAILLHKVGLVYVVKDGALLITARR